MKHKDIINFVILCLCVVSISYGGWAVLRLMTATDHPVLVVVSGSMVPTLNVGDMIFIRGMPAEKIEVGTIIVFHSPSEYDTLVVHRVVQKSNNNGTIYFRTKGDFNRYTDLWTVPDKNIVGVYSARVPYVGIVVMWLRTLEGTAFIVVLIVILIGYEAYSSSAKKRDQSGETRESEASTRTRRKLSFR